MRLVVDPLFVLEAERFGLRFRCDNCLHFLPSIERCAHAWPNEEHRGPLVPTEGAEVVFCKEFELE